MSMPYLPYDQSIFYPSRDHPHYDIAMALDLKPLPSYLAGPFIADDAHSHLTQSAAHIIPEPSQSLHYDNLPPPHISANGFTAIDAHGTHDLRHPIPMRPISTSQLYSSSSLIDNNGHSHESHSSTFAGIPFSEPSQFVLEQPIQGSRGSAIEQSQPPPPPPSWAMSGSLDPATGIYQTAPEHPRVRTAQACEKCRGRKAKCSGEHPTCERCRLRGLKCEYAAERKMRGPNKVKRKPGSVEAKNNRRTSVASSRCSSDDDTSDRARKSPFTTVPRAVGSSASNDMPPPADPAANHEVKSECPASSDSSEIAESSCPKHVDLTCTQFQPDHLLAPHSLAYQLDDESNPQAHRRASLPAWVLQAQAEDNSIYSGAIEFIDIQPRPHSNPLYPLQHQMGDELSRLSGVHSNSSEASSSRPLTPFSLSGMELVYPVDIDPHGVDFSSFEHYHDPGFMGFQETWSSPSINATLSATENDNEKSYTQL